MVFGGKANVYEEIIAEIKRMIAVGVLNVGDKMPSVRQYAVERKVNPNTVAKAYSVLEEEGVLKITPKKGAYVVGKTEANMGDTAQIRQMLVWAKENGMLLMVQDLTNPRLAMMPHVQLAAHIGTICGVECNAPQFYPEASLSFEEKHPGLYERRNGVVVLRTLPGKPGFGY